MKCPSCRCELELKVCKSNAGWYVGYRCDTCGPVERKSCYFSTYNEAEEVLDGFVRVVKTDGNK